MTKIYSLVFDYQISKMQNSGRHWAPEAYKNKDYIFSYSAASIATFLDKNPHLPYTIYTDDVDLLVQKLEAYTPSTANLSVVDHTSKIREWTQHPYCFWPLVEVAMMHHNGVEDALKLDNDLTCLKPIDELLKHRGAIVWKYERKVSDGRDYWGERKAAKFALGTEDFPIYNMGLFGLTKEYQAHAADVASYCDALCKVDISDVHRYPEKPGEKASMWSCSEQTAVNYFFHVNKVPVKEGHEFFEHHCYQHGKAAVLDRASYLLKK
jgi:hypothetical protein